MEAEVEGATNSEPVDRHSVDVSSDDEDECRVCRGGAEPGRPLFAPCKCSGSIGLVHQDCLTSWLAVTRGDGRCELCKTKFKFAPRYAEDAPDHLPFHEVVLGLCNRALAKWLPLVFRFLVAAALWLLVAPLSTAYLYHGWMNRPASILTRWKWELLSGDIVSGAVVMAMIVVSFLSLMSFADFLRAQWQHQAGRDRLRDDGIGNGFMEDEDRLGAAPGGRVGEDAMVAQFRDLQRRMRVVAARMDDEDDEDELDDGNDDDNNNGNNENDNDDDEDNQDEPEAEEAQQEVPQEPDDELIPVPDPDNIDEDDARNAGQDDDVHPAIIQQPLLDPQQEEAQIPLLDGFQDPPPAPPMRRNEDRFIRDPPGRRNGDRFDRQMDPVDPLLPDDQMDLEINIALDELLGLRGPLSALIRNLFWLLAFNTTYLGIFTFVPRTVGSAVYAAAFNSTAVAEFMNKVPFVQSEKSDDFALGGIISALNKESARLNTTFKLPDLAIITLGYFSCAFTVILGRFLWLLWCKLRNNSDERPNQGQNHEEERGHELFAAGLQGADDGDIHARLGDDLEPQVIVAGQTLSFALDATVAFAKVGILLFLKMFLLPVLLGIWLDGSTMALFGNSVQDRVLYAGGDLFSFILLHWVVGITFMLLVTVSVLQLREVVHPDLLSHLIRPQEPQPDLLGNLLHESVYTHTKRMVLSLAIYAALLTMHVYIPSRFLLAAGMGNMPFFRLKFWHILMPQLQVPLELLVFHLTMLALLEKYKNSIGDLQHKWLVFMCGKMGLLNHLLPLQVERFALVGTRRLLIETNAEGSGSQCDNTDENEGGESLRESEDVYLRPASGEVRPKQEQVDPFWYQLASAEGNVDGLIVANMDKTPSSEPMKYDCGETRQNGERILTGSPTSIRLSSPPVPTIPERSELMPTRIGRFRFKRRDALDEPPVIEIWEEVPGTPISRPPEGWDDLGLGGADVQGRWAWGKEKKSTIEEGVAQRSRFNVDGHSRWSFSWLMILKLSSLLVFSWLAVTLLVCVLLTVPFVIGRGLHYLLRVPDRFIHDPLSFALGEFVFIPIALLAIKSFGSLPRDGSSWIRVKRWLGRFRLPPRQKAFVLLTTGFLWSFVCPMCLGIFYEVLLVKSWKWFSGNEPFLSPASLLVCWAVGTFLLNAWAGLSYFSVLTREFWTAVGNGFMDPPDEANAPAAEAAGAPVQNARDEANPAPEERGPSWQGKDGRIGKFLKVWMSALLEWEWEAVDHVVLLRECALPVSRQLVTLLLGPSVPYGVFLYISGSLSSITTLGQAEGVYRMSVFRIFAVLSIAVQLCSGFNGALGNWFRAAHKAARDDRYLIGEVLMDYAPER